MGGEVAEISLMTNDLDAIEERAESITILIDRARAGDRQAFDQIMILHQRLVISTAWRMLGNREDARDAAQECFLRVYRYLKTFKRGEDFTGWLYRITINVCRDHARKRGKDRQFVSYEQGQEENGLASLSSRENVEEGAILSQERRIIELAIATLTKKERAALVLRDLEGLSTEEVSQILGSSQGTVRSQISSARNKIKRFRDDFLKQKQRG
ncbi:MAG TPA: RNA polymerase sigma factor [Blastocatellia bacterium]|jgi:RNA polymerase sigma-70 factor (ECF subfamily)|nr:RNA polymerase sigma factor [Blastocatellia bacterium]